MCARLQLLAALLLLPALAGRGGGEVLEAASSARAGPAFAPQQQREVTGRAGQAAELVCRVLRLGDKSVSWVRARDLQIMAHAGTVFTADARVSATAAGAAHSLRLAALRAGDAGRYECQVNTEPKLSLLFELRVLAADAPPPEPRLRALAPRHQAAAEGGAATLACEAHVDGEPPPDVRWLKEGRAVDAPGAAVRAEHGRAHVVSRLSLAALRARDAGEYQCAAGAARASLWLDVERMQRDQAASAARTTAPPAAPALLLLALPLLLRPAG